ncbi:glycosyltransferase [Paenibacillus paridis]|uniref:glycosyltransferase n=1 Tax=Paenibacillus paridis TaxID=2583376 RepID=UPI001120AC11|nr:glycosyltransferase family 2 protein [Paenibacillus paridis]
MILYFWDAACIAVGFLLFQPAWLANRKSSQPESAVSGAMSDEYQSAKQEGMVSVIIPARNEAHNLHILLPLLMEQTRLPYEIIVVDDGSEDATAETAAAYGVVVHKAQPLPQGWIGKSWACWQGANVSKGAWLVFIDADTRPMPQFLEQMHKQLQQTDGLITVQPGHDVPSFREQCSAFFNLVITAGSGTRSVFPMRTDGFGPCAACSREQYFEMGGHEKVRSEILEHVHLGKQFKSAGASSRLLLGKGLLQFRMYPIGWRLLVQGWSKSIGLGAGSTPFAMLLLVILWFSGLASAAIRLFSMPALPDAADWLASLVLYTFAVWTVARGLELSGTFKWYTKLFYPAYMLFFAAVFLYSFILSFVNRKVSWKGRQIDVP